MRQDNVSRGDEWLCRGAGVAGGLLLMVPHLWPLFSFLQLAAFLPVLYLAGRKKLRHRDALTAGFYMGIVYTLPQMLLLRLPAMVTLILLVQLTILLICFVWIATLLFRRRGILAAIAVGALLVAIDWVNITAVPFWGTAQSFVRPWSAYPQLISFASVTGLAGVAFLVVTLQGLAVDYILRRRRKTLVVAILLLVVFATINIITLNQKPIGTMKVAAIGWGSEDIGEFGQTSSEEGFDALFAKPAAEAVAKGAKVIVTPEMSFYFGYGDWQEWVGRFGEIAQRGDVFLVIGYFNGTEDENRVFFMAPDGEIVCEYTKTYLLPFENGNKGDGSIKTIDVDGFKVGAMICQDDNFTSLSRKYGRLSASLVAVPTFDWVRVKNTHLQNSLHRAIESRYAIVRAATDGISAIIAPGGRILARRDHFVEGPGAVVAEVLIYENQTLFSRFGNWLVGVCGLYLVIYIGWLSARRFGLRRKK